jgi:gliding motility-associated-like protein
MRIIKYILSIGLVLALWSSVARAQEYQSVVCAGDTGVAYSVEGWDGSSFEWTVNGGVITRNFGDSIIVDWTSIPGIYSVMVQENSEYGCVGPPVVSNVLVSSPDIDLGGDTYACRGNVFEITPAGEFTSYLWQDGSTGPSYSTDQEGWISVKVTDVYGCPGEDSLYLSIYDLPLVDLGNDTSLCGDESLMLDAGPYGQFYNWSTGDVSQQITVYQAGYQEIWVEIEDEYGCLNSDTVIIEPCDIEFYFRDMPTAITTNDDGVNDVWNIEKLAGYTQAVMEIYDQWGTMVWRSEPGYPQPWDGRDMNGRLVPVDSYHFVINFNDGSSDPLVGIVTVIH